MSIKMDLTGLDDYLEKLARAEKDIDHVADDALTAAGKILYPEIHNRVPVMAEPIPGRPAPGNLKEHIVVNGPFQDGNQHYLYVELDMRDRELMLYGVYVEFGHGTVAPHSYIRAGVAAGKKRAIDAMRRVFEERFAA